MLEHEERLKRQPNWTSVKHPVSKENQFEGKVLQVSGCFIERAGSSAEP
jgi:hypothetical protein